MEQNRVKLTQLVQTLARRLKQADEKVVFLLGAGCSMQYGIPSFSQLLTYLRADLDLPCLETTNVTLLRDGKFETTWLRTYYPPEHQKMVARHLRLVHGKECPAYRQLARLAGSNLIHAFINMNFDTLLEEALDAENVSYSTSSTFLKKSKTSQLMIYKPHGSIGRLDFRRKDEDIDLDIATSDLFSNEERNGARKLLAPRAVVVIGYSGLDRKLADTMTPEHERPNREPGKQLFLINPSEPYPGLLRAAERRDPKFHLTTGPEANFENFMEHLSNNLRHHATPHDPLPKAEASFDVMTDSEKAALDCCIQLAKRIRAGMNVAETSSLGIEDHARDIFQWCTDLARAARISLSSPEKYLLRSAAVFHDLGYFFAFSGGRTAEAMGWLLLNRHGRYSVHLIEERCKEIDSPREDLIPSSYDPAARESLFQFLLNLCQFHAALRVPRRALSGVTDPLIVEVDGVPTRVRFHLLQALLAAAENIDREHSFLPSSDPIPAGERDGHRAVEDPFLDLYLRWKKDALTFTVEGNVLRANFSPEVTDEIRHGKVIQWLLTMTSEYVKALDRQAREAHKAFRKTVDEDPVISFDSQGVKLHEKIGDDPQKALKDLLRGALEEALKDHIKDHIETAEKGSVGEASSLLDLLSIYGLCTHTQEPRVPLKSPVIKSAMRRVDGRKPERGVLHIYLKVEPKQPRTSMEEMFRKTFKNLLYPGWRFLARNWRDNIEAILTARACLDLGSSRFRAEVVGGMKLLLREKVYWRNVDGATHAFGHGGCMLCTSRLLYVFTAARQLFPKDELEKLAVDRRGRRINDAVRGILLHLLSLGLEDPAWSGTVSEKNRKDDERTKSPDYAAWAASALASCVATHREIRDKTGESWLNDACGVPEDSVLRLAQERWRALLKVKRDDLMSDRVEEPHSFTLGQIAVSCLSLHDLPTKVREEIVPRGPEFGAFCQEIKKAHDELKGSQRRLAQLSKFYLWPATMFLHSISPDEALEDDMVRTCHDFLHAPLWIKRRADAGSWGFNVKNTSTLLVNLNTFWRYAFEGNDGGNRERFEAAFERYQKVSRR